ncbi:hypothetical protein M9H77_13457 [Catharanthus roseus]|uniref:Uncharacterized protein n=1 Tax=Catharanthus roseus TaxID=4058 RepID=A0ACC0BKH2_CATRO|nr:hypothetical protein M9H77_13457 [Catharanthus roseus]
MSSSLPSSTSLAFSSSSSSSSSLGSSPDVSEAVKSDITEIISLCSNMDRLWRSIPAMSQRDLWKRKVEQVAEEADALKDSLDKYFLRNQRRIIFDDEAQAMQSVQSSSRMLDEAYATGVAVLSKYSEQRDHLKGAQRKALDVLNRSGLSNSVLRLIEKSNRIGRWIKYTGMIVTVMMIIMFWRWTS